jgi:probable O-glycosylation ligase (exosortase A-associated)
VKQLLFLAAITLAGSVGSLYQPFWGLLLYYTFAVLRPQHMWEWALPVTVRWSLIAAAMVGVGLMLNLSKLRGRFNAIAGMMLAYAFLMLMSILTAYNPTIALNWGVEYAKIIGIAVVGTLIIGSYRQVKVIAIMTVICLGYIAWEINSLYIFDNRLDIFHYGYAKLDNNGAGLMLAMGIPFAYVFGMTSPKRWQRAGCGFLALLMVHAVLMSYSRGAMLSSIVGIAWLLIHHRKRFQALALVVALGAAVSVLAGQEIQDRFISTKDYQTDNSANSRLESWAAAWQIAGEHPIFGIGIRNSNVFTENYGADMTGRTIHSQYLQIAADSGMPAMGLYTAMMVGSLIAFGRARRMCRRAEDELPRDAESKRRELQHMATLALGLQTSLLIFGFGALFLSLEVFELPWLLMTIAGLLPMCVRRQIEEIQQRGPDAEPEIKSAHTEALALIAARRTASQA